MRCQREGERRAGFIPYSVVVAGPNAEPIIAGGNLVVSGDPLRFCLHPLVIQPFQLVLEPDPFRRNETERRIIELQFPRVGRKSGGNTRIETLVACINLFHEHRGWPPVPPDLLRIDYHHTIDCRKPEPTIPAPAAGGLASALALG